MVGVEGCEDASFRIYSYMRGGYCKVGRRREVGREVGRGIEVEECEKGVGDVGTPNLRLVVCRLRVLGRAMDVEVSYDDVVSTGVKKKEKSGHKIGGIGGVRRNVDVDVDGNLVDDGCYGEEVLLMGKRESVGKLCRRWSDA